MKVSQEHFRLDWLAALLCLLVPLPALFDRPVLPARLSAPLITSSEDVAVGR